MLRETSRNNLKMIAGSVVLISLVFLFLLHLFDCYVKLYLFFFPLAFSFLNVILKLCIFSVFQNQLHFLMPVDTPSGHSCLILTDIIYLGRFSCTAGLLEPSSQTWNWPLLQGALVPFIGEWCQRQDGGCAHCLGVALF